MRKVKNGNNQVAFSMLETKTSNLRKEPKPKVSQINRTKYIYDKQNHKAKQPMIFD